MLNKNKWCGISSKQLWNSLGKKKKLQGIIYSSLSTWKLPENRLSSYPIIIVIVKTLPNDFHKRFLLGNFLVTESLQIFHIWNSNFEPFWWDVQIAETALCAAGWTHGWWLVQVLRWRSPSCCLSFHIPKSTQAPSALKTAIIIHFASLACIFGLSPKLHSHLPSPSLPAETRDDRISSMVGTCWSLWLPLPGQSLPFSWGSPAASPLLNYKQAPWGRGCVYSTQLIWVMDVTPKYNGDKSNK